MKNLLIITCLAWLGLTADPARVAANETTIVVQPSARIDGPIVSLGEIAKIVTDRQELEAELQEVPLTAAPTAQRTISITINDIRDILTARGYDTTAIRITGASRSEVRRSVTASAEDSSPAANKPIGRRPIGSVPVDNASVAQVSAAGPVGTASQIPAGLVRPKSQQSKPSQRMPLASLADDHTSEEQALHTTRHLRRGEILQAADLELRPITAVRREEHYPTELTSLVGKELTHALAMDRPVSADDVRQPILIRRNEIVTVISRAGNVTVRREVVARGDAGQGELLDVETLEPRRSGRTRHSNQFQVIVTGPGEAQVLADSIQAKPSDR